VGEDWDGLSRLVRESLLNEREEILEVIREVRVYDTREALLKKFNGGRAWLFMERELFPQLRRVEMRIEYTTKEEKEVTVASPPKEMESDAARISSTSFPPLPPERSATSSSGSEATSTSFPSLPPERSATSFKSEATALFALKSNLLPVAGVQYDFGYTAPVANVALGYYIDDHWSVEAGALYSNWHYNSRREFQGLYGRVGIYYLT
jgi:hypothetical protein